MQRTSTKDVYDSLKKEELTSADVSLIMSEVRKLIDENEVWRRSLKVLHFYCDWCQHDKIDRNTGCVQLITELNQCLWQLDSAGNRDDSRKMDVAGFLRIPQLREELNLVLSATYAKRINATLTFVYALFRYLINIPIVPVDAVDGKLKSNSKAYKELCAKLQVGENRPLIKNFVIEYVGENSLEYNCDMDGVETIIHGIVDFDYCTRLPFEVADFGDPCSLEEGWFQKMKNVQRLIHEGATLDAYHQLLQMQKELESIPGMDNLRNDVNLQCFEIGWALTGDPQVFVYGEKAAIETTDTRRAVPIYHNLSLYSLQKGLFDKADEYLSKGMTLAIHTGDKAPVYQLKGRIHFARQEYDDALKAFMEAEEYANQVHEELRKVYIIINAAEVLSVKGLHQIAISEISRAEQIAIDLHNLPVVMRCMLKKAQIYYSCGQDDEAKTIIEHIPLQFD